MAHGTVVANLPLFRSNNFQSTVTVPTYFCIRAAVVVRTEIGNHIFNKLRWYYMLLFMIQWKRVQILFSFT